MDNKSLGQHPADINNADTFKTSRLPAGSTLKVGDVHIPHPHAEVNLPGAGDTRLGDTKAVTEELVTDRESGEQRLNVRPLDEDVKPKVVKVVDVEPGVATEADKKLVVVDSSAEANV